MGHEVIRLPPYHCQYNSIELIWAQVKNQVAKNNFKTFKMVDLEKLTHEALDSVTQHDWEKCVRHAKSLQDQDNEKEIMRDSMLEPIILTLLPDDSDWESSDDKFRITFRNSQLLHIIIIFTCLVIFLFCYYIVLYVLCLFCYYYQLIKNIIR